MRVPFSAFNNTLLPRLQNLSEAQNKAMSQLASGQRVTRASDDPLAVNRGLQLETRKNREQQYYQNGGHAKDLCDATFSQLQHLTDISTRVSELSSQASGTSSAADLKTYATEINELIENAVDTANGQFQGDYLFAGSNTGNAPFTVTRSALTGKVSAASYVGGPATPASPPATVDTTAGSTTVGVGSAAGLAAGMKVTVGAFSSTIVAVDTTNNTITLADAPTSTQTGAAAVFSGDEGSGIRVSASEMVHPGTSGDENAALATFINNLVALRDGMTTGNSAAVVAARTALNTSEDGLMSSITRLGTIQYRLDFARTQATNTFAALDKEFGQQVDIDFAQVTLNLNRTQTAYQAALQSAARIASQSLLDYLR